VCTALTRILVDSTAGHAVLVVWWLRVHWRLVAARCAVTAVPCPGMGVLTKIDELKLGLPANCVDTTIAIARQHLLIREAAALATFWATVGDANLLSVVKLGIILAVEFRSAHLRFWNANPGCRRNLEINIQVFRASTLSMAILVTMLCEHTLSIFIAGIF